MLTIGEQILLLFIALIFTLPFLFGGFWIGMKYERVKNENKLLKDIVEEYEHGN